MDVWQVLGPVMKVDVFETITRMKLKEVKQYGICTIWENRDESV